MTFHDVTNVAAFLAAFTIPTSAVVDARFIDKVDDLASQRSSGPRQNSLKHPNMVKREPRQDAVNPS